MSPTGPPIPPANRGPDTPPTTPPNLPARRPDHRPPTASEVIADQNPTRRASDPTHPAAPTPRQPERPVDASRIAAEQHSGRGLSRPDAPERSGSGAGDASSGAGSGTGIPGGADGGGLAGRARNGPLDRVANQRDADGNRTAKAEVARSLDNRTAAERVKDARDEGGNKAAAVEGAKEAAAAGVQAASGGVIPKKATRAAATLMQKSKTARVAVAAAPILPIVVPVVAIFTVIILLSALLSGGVALDGGIPSNSFVAKTVSADEHLESIQLAALEYEVPWTVLASISLLATENGKFSPYPDDLVDRDPLREGIRRPNSGTVGAPAAPTISASGPITVIGDSLCEPGAAGDALAGALSTAGWSPTLDCSRGRALTGDGEAVATRAVAAGTPVVIALGTNDAVGTNAAAFKASLDRVMAASTTTPVTWVNVGTNQPGTAAINQELAAAVARYPNLSVADFASDTAANQALIAADGIHLQGDGYAVRAGRITSTLTGGAVAGPAAGGITYPENPEDLKVSTYPKVEPAIGGEGSPGLGPYLLAPRVLSSSSGSVDAQNVGEDERSATMWLARQMRQVADQVRAEGWEPGDSPETNDQFWTEVVRRLPIADPRAAQGCPTPPVTADPATDQSGFRSQVALAITEVWRCEINNAPSFHTLTGPTTEAGAIESPSIVIDEALTVAWAFSSWGTAACDPNAATAGVFPLSAEVFSAYGQGDRCAVSDNITAAAKAFIAGEQVAPGERSGDAGAIGDRSADRGRYHPMVGGWAAMPWALGSTENLEKFLVDGRGSTTVLDSTCHAAITGWVERAGVDTTLPGDPAGALASLRSSPVFTGACPPGTFDDSAVSSAISAAATAEAAYLRSIPELLEGGVGDPAENGVEFDYGDTEPGATPEGEPRVVGRAELDARAARLDSVVAALAGEGTTPFAGGVDASVTRLSATGRSPIGRPGVPVPATPAVDEHASTVVALAVSLGGTYEADPRGNDPDADGAGIIRSFWGAGSLSGAGGQLGSDIPFADVFNAAGAQHGMDPRLLAAVAKAESGFSPANISCENRSGAGAMGIMQFMPGTARGFGIDPCDPAQAIPAAAQYLTGLYAKFGDWEIALAGYNWGPNRSSIRDRGSWPPETAKYVPKVMGYWEEYKQQYPDGSLAVGGGALGPGPVSPEMCPRTAPAGTVRKGAEAIGIFELCRRSVLAAPSPVAAKAIVAAMSNLGLSYSQPRRLDADKCDCTSFLSRAYRMAGIDTFNFGGRSGNYAPWTGSFLGGEHSSWATKIGTAELRPGDIVITPGHAVMPLADGMIVHCTGPTSEVRDFYGRNRIVQVFRVNPAAPPPPAAPTQF